MSVKIPRSSIKPKNGSTKSRGENKNRLVQLKNYIDEKVKTMREAKFSLPQQLYTSTSSELKMVFKKEQLRPSICLVPPLPEDKYREYLDFLMKESKQFVYFLWVSY